MPEKTAYWPKNHEATRKIWWKSFMIKYLLCSVATPATVSAAGSEIAKQNEDLGRFLVGHEEEENGAISTAGIFNSLPFPTKYFPNVFLAFFITYYYVLTSI